MHVDFDKGTPRTYDLVVGADGVHSRVRALSIDPAADSIQHLGLAGVGFTITDPFDLDHNGVLWQAPGRAAYVVDADEPGRRTVSLSFASTSARLDRTTRTTQETAVADAFEGSGWRIPELLIAMHTAPDFYFASSLQVVLPRWSRDRIVLVGDAAGCAAPTSGMGTSQALLAAAELARHVTLNADYPTAFTTYEDTMRPIVEANQEAGRQGATTFGAYPTT